LRQTVASPAARRRRHRHRRRPSRWGSSYANSSCAESERRRRPARRANWRLTGSLGADSGDKGPRGQTIQNGGGVHTDSVHAARSTSVSRPRRDAGTCFMSQHNSNRVRRRRCEMAAAIAHDRSERCRQASSGNSIRPAKRQPRPSRRRYTLISRAGRHECGPLVRQTGAGGRRRPAHYPAAPVVWVGGGPAAAAPANRFAWSRPAEPAPCNRSVAGLESWRLPATAAVI
jgi:hypothetical protein